MLWLLLAAFVQSVLPTMLFAVGRVSIDNADSCTCFKAVRICRTSALLGPLRIEKESLKGFPVSMSIFLDNAVLKFTNRKPINVYIVFMCFLCCFYAQWTKHCFALKKTTVNIFRLKRQQYITGILVSDGAAVYILVNYSLFLLLFIHYHQQLYRKILMIVQHRRNLFGCH